MIKHKKLLYREARAPLVIDDTYWRHAQLNFWIYCVVESQTGTDLPARQFRKLALTWNNLPAEIRRGVDQDVDSKYRVMNCLDRGACHYIALEGVGWAPGVPQGDQYVSVVQNLLEWIERFQRHQPMSGSQLLWASIETAAPKR